MRTYKEKLNALYTESVSKSGDILVTPEKGYFAGLDSAGVPEFLSFVKKFMKQFDIGSMLSEDKWGNSKIRQIQGLFRKMITPPKSKPSNTFEPPKSTLQVYDTLKDDVVGKKFSTVDFKRVARTETARLKAVFQLMKFKEAGLKYVIHRNNAVSVAKKTVGKRDKAFNNRVLEIDYLLSKAGAVDRIPLHPNCMCRYQASMKGL